MKIHSSQYANWQAGNDRKKGIYITLVNSDVTIIDVKSLANLLDFLTMSNTKMC